MDQNVRLSAGTLKVLKFLLSNPKEGISGAEISRATGVGSGTLYPMLARLEFAGWLYSEWEAVDPSEAGRPRRRFYKLSGLGQSSAMQAFAEFQFVQGEPIWNS